MDEIRAELYEIIDKHGATSKEALIKSQELDPFIVQEQIKLGRN